MDSKLPLILTALAAGCGGNVEAQDNGMSVESDAGLDGAVIDAFDATHDDVIDVIDAGNDVEDAGDASYLKEMFVSPRVFNHEKKQDWSVRASFNELPEESYFGLYDESFNEISFFGGFGCSNNCDDPNRLENTITGTWGFIPAHGNYYVKYMGKVGGQIVEEQFYPVRDEEGAETYCPEDGVICLNQIDVLSHSIYSEGSKDAECMSFYVVNKTGEEIRFSLAQLEIFLSSDGMQIAVDEDGQPWFTNVRFAVSDNTEAPLYDIPLTDSDVVEQSGDIYYVLDSVNEIYFPADAKPRIYSLLMDLREGTENVAPWCSLNVDAYQIVTSNNSSFDIDKFQVTPGDNYEGHKTHLTSINLPQ